ncbi:hypothetical protein PG994_004719 [Apiospora phragmitis]|uniref:Uncharacterized protein n=1 Tax=Apiospora phragmitis TaxID=2905665 RepID=A0ABR1VUE7_9PEZI
MEVDSDDSDDSDDGPTRQALAKRIKELEQESANYQHHYAKLEKERNELLAKDTPGQTPDIDELREEVRLLRTAANIIQTPVAPKGGMKISTQATFDGTSGNLRGFLVQI